MTIAKLSSAAVDPVAPLLHHIWRRCCTVGRSINHSFACHGRREQISATSYLDGLRGLAALAVINYHFMFAFTDIAQIGYGYDDKHKALLALPGIRLLYDGSACVIVFFSISGYVCSNRALRLMTEIAMSDDENRKSLTSRKLLQQLAGSVFRRWFRLFLPTLAMSLMIAVGAYLGVFEPLRPLLDQRAMYFPHSSHFSEPQLKRFPTLYGQLSYWTQDMSEILDVFAPGPVYPHHDMHLWTISYEFRLSMHLYVVLLALSWCKPVARMACLVVISLVYFRLNHWEGPLFFLGAALAQWNILMDIKDQQQLPQRETKVEKKVDSTAVKRDWKLLRFLAYVLAIHLMGFPVANTKFPAPGYNFINQLIPNFYKRKEKLSKSVGVLLLLYLLSSSSNKMDAARPSLLHRLFTCRFAIFLGQHMFSLYLVHGTVLHTIGYGLPHLWWKFIPNKTPVAYYSGLIFGWFWSVVFSLILARLFTRTIDAKCIKVTKWLEARCFVEDGS